MALSRIFDGEKILQTRKHKRETSIVPSVVAKAEVWRNARSILVFVTAEYLSPVQNDLT